MTLFEILTLVMLGVISFVQVFKLLEESKKIYILKKRLSRFIAGVRNR